MAPLPPVAPPAHVEAMPPARELPSREPMPPPVIAAAPSRSPRRWCLLPQDKGKGRQLAGVGAKKIVGRPLSTPSKRGVQLEPLDPKIVKMLDLQSNILERLRAKLDLDKVPMDRLTRRSCGRRRARDDRPRRDRSRLRASCRSTSIRTR